MSKPVLCPRCKAPMAYIQEIERVGDERRITRYYKCPACGTKILDEVIRIYRVNGSVVIMVEQNGHGKIIQPQRIRRHRPHRRNRR